MTEANQGVVVTPTCPICRELLAGKPMWAVGRTTFCESCFRSRIDRKRLDRISERLKGMKCDPLAHRQAEIRRLIEERDKWRAEIDAIKEKIRFETRVEEIDRIRKLPFLSRVRLCFSPFAVGLDRSEVRCVK